MFNLRHFISWLQIFTLFNFDGINTFQELPCLHSNFLTNGKIMKLIRHKDELGLLKNENPLSDKNRTTSSVPASGLNYVSVRNSGFI